MHRTHRRATKVCFRCKHRKTKCDFKFPVCTPCKLAGIDCKGYDPTSKQAVPRSLVRSLEGRVAELEAQMLGLQTGPQNVPFYMGSRISQATTSVGVPSSASYLHSKISSIWVCRPSCPPLAVVMDREGQKIESPMSTSDISTIMSTSNPIDLKSIPDSSISRMIRNYTEFHLPQYPCIHESMLDDIVSRTRTDRMGDTNSLLLNGVPEDSGLGHFEYFVLLITLAISANTLTWKAEDQARAASEAFFNSAIKHLQALGEHSEINSLQISLLLAHYAHMCPERLDNWTCILDAVQIVINLGLYNEPPPGIDEGQRQLRSTLFWVAYGMERSLCSNLRLPLSFPEEIITVKHDVFVDEGYDTLFSGEDLRKKSAANHIYLYRALETEVHRVLHLLDDQPLSNTGMDVEAWTRDVIKRLDSWYEAAKPYGAFGMLEFSLVQYRHLRLRIYRPTPRLPVRTDQDREIVLQSALALIEDYGSQEERKRLFYPWHAVHILFETVVVSLEACLSSRGSLAMRPLINTMLETYIPQCLHLLPSIGQKWNEAVTCSRRLLPLHQAIVAGFEAWDQGLMTNEEDISQDIQSLLAFDGSLKWNQRPFDINFGFEDAFLLNDPTFEGLEFLEWAPEWDLQFPNFT